MFLFLEFKTWEKTRKFLNLGGWIGIIGPLVVILVATVTGFG